jgi:hypothetical protein
VKIVELRRNGHDVKLAQNKTTIKVAFKTLVELESGKLLLQQMDEATKKESEIKVS